MKTRWLQNCLGLGVLGVVLTGCCCGHSWDTSCVKKVKAAIPDEEWVGPGYEAVARFEKKWEKRGWSISGVTPLFRRDSQATLSNFCLSIDSVAPIFDTGEKNAVLAAEIYRDFLREFGPVLEGVGVRQPETRMTLLVTFFSTGWVRARPSYFTIASVRFSGDKVFLHRSGPCSDEEEAYEELSLDTFLAQEESVRRHWPTRLSFERGT